MTRAPHRLSSMVQSLLLLAALPYFVAITADGSKNLVTLPSPRTHRDRIEFVGKNLCDRLDYVLNRKRGADFREWIRERGGDATIFSMHGVDVNFEVDPESGVDLHLDDDGAVSRHTRRGDPFLPNRMSLELSDAATKVHYKSYAYEWDRRPPSAVQLSLRALKLSFTFGPVVATSGLALISRRFRQYIWYRWVASSLASCGSAFIKWGQWASTRSDMFSIGMCDALGDLLSSAPAHSWDITQTIVESSLDIPQGSLLEVFASFDPKPLASGSIAQVHKARLKSGEPVAIKVRHPRVAELIDMDFRLMTLLANFCDWIPGLRWLHIKDSVSQFSHTMAAQADLHVEAHHLEVLNDNFQNWPHVRFPQPFYASSSVIFETFEPGQIVPDILDVYDAKATEIGGGGAPRPGYELIPTELAKFLVTTGVSLYLKMLLVDNLMHADLHPGNILLDVTSDSDSQNLAITLVDAGMVAQLTEEESSTFIGLLCSLGEGDGRAAADFALRFSLENTMGEEEREIFAQEMIKLFSERCGGYGTNVDVGNVLRGILGLIRDHHVRIDANYATLVVNVLCVESLGNRVCPSYNVLDASKPLLQAYRKMCFKNDGITPRAGTKIKRVKSLMPLMYMRKKITDDAFFKKKSLEQRRLDKN